MNERQRKLKVNMLRGLEKIPGLNLQQVIFCDETMYILIPKCGTRSIRNYVMNSTGSSRTDVLRFMRYFSKRELNEVSRAFSTKLVVRHPLDRLISCWKQKITAERDNGSFYFFQYYPLLRPNMSFLEFLKAVDRIPSSLSEKHYRPVSITVEQDSPFIDVITLDDLDITLRTHLGEIATEVRSNLRANSTSKYHPSVNEIDFYQDHLARRFEKDLRAFETAQLAAQSNK